MMMMGSSFAADSVVQRITIESAWGGLGETQRTKLVIRNDDGTFHLGRKRIASALVDAFIEATQESPATGPSLQSLDITDTWLNDEADQAPKQSGWWMLRQGFPAQKKLFRESFTDGTLVAKVVPTLFTFVGFDDYPSVEVSIIRSDGSITTVASHSYYQYMLPWKISTGDTTISTFNRRLSLAIAALMPPKATNRGRLAGQGFAVALAEAVMREIEGKWKLLGTEEKAPAAIAALRTQYTVLAADINPYHDVTFGEKWKAGKGEEENLHATVRRDSFPSDFSDAVILLYKDNSVWGVQDFLHNASSYEDLVLSVPWLAKLRSEYPNWPMTLQWVHGASPSDKGMQNFAEDMHTIGRDSLAEEVRRMQPKVAVLNISYGDYWLVLPDQRMVLWRYESRMGLLGLTQSDFPVHPCADYQGVTGGCVGAVISPEGKPASTVAQQ